MCKVLPSSIGVNSNEFHIGNRSTLKMPTVLFCDWSRSGRLSRAGAKVKVAGLLLAEPVTEKGARPNRALWLADAEGVS